MMPLRRGDVHLVDLGMAAKTRPCVVISIPKADSQRNMSVIAPLTTEIRQGETEIPFEKPAWLLDRSAISLIGMGGVDNARIGRLIGHLPDTIMEKVDHGLLRMFGLRISSRRGTGH
jgi:mRNA interferase MazF